MLQNDLIPQMDRIGERKPLWFMQDNAPLNYATIVRRGTVEWAPRSPDLT
ncbi:hypothetical protein A3Q56_00922 [Intoshia linei]|uniref:Uncharacterized protein n=1 Tax=Intoshia linei TaxID=1819745 RepID=A0A177BCF5_9BILA|nr:hypothetical protein A3Q56_00922 [Intoshia linei]